MAKGLPSLAPGFRFHPTDEELILHYLRKRAAALPWPVSLIADVDIYKFDPWDLPAKAKFGEREWYFFSPRDRKYPNGDRPNRSAASGYWKATGTDKAIVASQSRENIGVKKTLVFYKGKPNNGVKTSWIMHEYRLNDQYLSCGHKPLVKQREDSMRLDDWVLCRIYQKNRGQALVGEEQGNSVSEETEKQNSAWFSLSEMLTEEADYYSVSRMLETQMSSTVSDMASFSNPELIHPLEQNIDGICSRYSEGPVFDGCYGD